MRHSRATARGERAYIRAPSEADAGEFCARARASVDLHRPWVHPPLDLDAYRAYLARFGGKGDQGYLVCRADDDAIAGFVNLNNIVRGSYQSAEMGYAAFEPSAGQGLMTEGVILAVRVAFADLHLHRVEAGIQPGNHRSHALIRRCGFRLEGYSPGYLFIDGAWRDHYRYGITVEHWQQRPPG
jgi:ribosomal-protein-alanine N-acetyltransferase